MPPENLRWRLVSQQGGERHVSSVVMNEEEAWEALEIERQLHELAGWQVTEFLTRDTEGCKMVVARLGRLERVLSAEAFSPMADNETSWAS